VFIVSPFTAILWTASFFDDPVSIIFFSIRLVVRLVLNKKGMPGQCLSNIGIQLLTAAIVYAWRGFVKRKFGDLS